MYCVTKTHRAKVVKYTNAVPPSLLSFAFDTCPGVEEGREGRGVSRCYHAP